MLNKYVVGIDNLDTEEVIFFEDEKDADYRAHEWVKIWGLTPEYAIENYEYAFEAWRLNTYIGFSDDHRKEYMELYR
jgi:hypothetical protein